MDNLKQLRDLNDQEVQTLVRLLVRMAAIDGNSSETELQKVAHVADDVGRARFDAAVQAAIDNPLTESQLLDATHSIRPSARALFVQELAALSKTDGVKGAEDEFFRKIVEAWRSELL